MRDIMLDIQDLLRPYGITRIRDFASKGGISRARAAQIWNGETGIGRVIALRIHSNLGIPLEYLLMVTGNKH